MNDINQVTLLGRLTRDPEVPVAPTGIAVASFSIASNRRYQDKSGQWQEEVAFMACVAFGRTAEQMAERHKGDAVLVAGRLKTETWQQNGVNRSRLVLVAETARAIQPLPTSKGDAETQEPVPAAEEVRKSVPF